jgi:hypothetical protein
MKCLGFMHNPETKFQSGDSRETESSECENANIKDENNAHCIFYAKGIIQDKFVPENIL